MKSDYVFHPATFEVLTREVYNLKVSYPTAHYLMPLWLTLDYYRPRTKELVHFLRTQIVQNRLAVARAVIYEERVHYQRLISYERRTLAAIYIISRHLNNGKGKGEYTHAFNADEKKGRRGYPALSQTAQRYTHFRT